MEIVPPPPPISPLTHFVLLAARQELARKSRVSTVDVAAVRLWLDTQMQPEMPSNVMAGCDEGVGAT